ncbi:hypothetical protein CRM75_07960 [Enterococcus faecium]|uniref:Uncharacterized protein n=1 Tax=Enterococcus faecium TaxID=1352 RepID=A0A2A7SWN8_ENTFC|nr:hypothetical protein [Enterococcus faecium]KAA0690393.1 hypothetical protein DTX73_08730 [Enterococcus faecium]PEH47839.1 hypothetical protein CRM75_07960 [Enterococcus faecium]
MFCHKPFSRINGIQKLASAVISPTKRKIGGAIFVWLFLLLDAGQLFHNFSLENLIVVRI